MIKFPLSPRSILYAPMEGITDEVFRLAVLKCYPEWDYVATDFLRVPASGYYPKKHIIDHIGKSILENEPFKKKTIYQILTSEKSHTIETLETIQECELNWIDLNLGCPSRTVNTHGGGAFLLQDLVVLKKIIQTIRQTFPHIFTAKIRLGYRDDKNFEDIIQLLCDEGVNAITIHARTRDQLYHGIADWSYIQKAVKISSVPIIGNGDIWNIADIEKIFDFTGCHSVMIARGALKTPWLASLYKNKIQDGHDLRCFEIQRFFSMLSDGFLSQGLSEQSCLKRLKSVCRYMFDDLPQGQAKKRGLLLSKNLCDFNKLLKDISFIKIEKSA